MLRPRILDTPEDAKTPHLSYPVKGPMSRVAGAYISRWHSSPGALLLRNLAALALVGVSLTGGTAPESVEDLSSPAGPGSGEPSLVVAPNGTVYMSWLEPVGSAHALRFASFDGRKWTEPRTIRSGTDFFVNWADFPSMEVLDGKRLAAHWLQRAGKSTYAYHVKVVLSSDGGATWSAPIMPHTDTSATEHGFVAFWREGSALGATWLDGRKYNKEGHDPSNEMTVRSTMIDRNGKRGREVELDGRACDCCQTTATMTGKGPVIAYRDRSPAEIRDIYVVRRVNGKWTSPAPVHDDSWKINACPVNGPALASQGNRVALAWFTAANDSPRVKLAFSSDAGASWGSPVRIDNGAPGGRVDAAMLDDGSALVTWIERVGGDTAAVRVRRVTPDGKPGAPVTVATSSAARASGFPRMAVTGGQAMFAYTIPGRPSSIRVSRIPLSRIR